MWFRAGVVGQLRHQAVLVVARFRAVLGATSVATCCRDGCGWEICDPDRGAWVYAGAGAAAGTHQDVDGPHSIAVTCELAGTAPVVAPGRPIDVQAGGAGFRGVRLVDVLDGDTGLLGEVAFLAAASPLREAAALMPAGVDRDDHVSGLA